MNAMKQTKITLRKGLAILLLAAVIATGIVVALRNNSPASQDRLTVSATYYPLYEFAKQVGGNKIRVINMTPAGSEPHDYEPAARALADAQQTDVFIYNGGRFEPWTDGFLRDYTNTAVRASDGIGLTKIHHDDHPEDKDADEHGHDNRDGQDPHFWLDPIHAQQIVANIRDGLIRADPQHKAHYTERATAYSAALQQLDTDFRSGLANCEQDAIITAHQAFGYMAQRYGFTMEAIAGLSPEEEPSAARLAELSDMVTSEGIRYVFFESLVSPRLADTIAQETGAETLVLNPIEGLSNEDQKQGKDYLSVQRENLANLRAALACR